MINIPTLVNLLGRAALGVVMTLALVGAATAQRTSGSLSQQLNRPDYAERLMSDQEGVLLQGMWAQSYGFGAYQRGIARCPELRTLSFSELNLVGSERLLREIVFNNFMSPMLGLAQFVRASTAGGFGGEDAELIIDEFGCEAPQTRRFVAGAERLTDVLINGTPDTAMDREARRRIAANTRTRQEEDAVYAQELREIREEMEELLREEYADCRRTPPTPESNQCRYDAYDRMGDAVWELGIATWNSPQLRAFGIHARSVAIAQAPLDACQKLQDTTVRSEVERLAMVVWLSSIVTRLMQNYGADYDERFEFTVGAMEEFGDIDQCSERGLVGHRRSVELFIGRLEQLVDQLAKISCMRTLKPPADLSVCSG